MLKTIIANLSAGFGPRKTALVIGGLVVGVAAIIGGAAAPLSRNARPADMIAGAPAGRVTRI